MKLNRNPYLIFANRLFIVLFMLISHFLSQRCLSQQGFFKTGWPAYTGYYEWFSDSTHYTDSVRANITGISVISGGLTRLTLDANHSIGTFYNNDHILLIQMTTGLGTNTGRWEEVTVASKGSGYIDIATPVRKYTANDNAHPNARLQIIKIPYWSGIRITNQGSLECHKWDGYTGGILCFVTRHLWIENGRISAAGKGFYDSYSPGNGGSGGLGDTTYGNLGGGLSPFYERMCTVPLPTIGNYADGINGEYGEGPEPYSLASNGNAPNGNCYVYPASIDDTSLTMGNSGGFSSSVGGGKGGIGGGHGGKGGRNALNWLGDDGKNGSNAGNGGMEGHSGRGGGIILFKADTVRFNCDYVQQGAYETNAFWVNGEAGDPGKNGGKGGNGGNGGKGAVGSQVSNFLNYSGGWGGSGKPGKGAQGGRGGHGGQGGYVRFYYNYAPSCFIYDISNYMESVNAMYQYQRMFYEDGENGKAGKGGIGGFATVKPGGSAIKFSVTTPYDTCVVSGTGSTWTDKCDCNTVFDELTKLSLKYNGTFLSNGPDTTTTSVGLPANLYDRITIKESKGKIIFFDQGNKVRWHCNMTANNAFFGWVDYITGIYKSSLGGSFDKNPVKLNQEVHFRDAYSTNPIPTMYYSADSQFLCDNSFSPKRYTWVIPCGNVNSNYTDTLKGDDGPTTGNAGWGQRSWFYWGGDKIMWFSKGNVQMQKPKVLNPIIICNYQSNVLNIYLNNDLPNLNNSTINVYNMAGQLVKTCFVKEINQNKVIIPVTGLQKGIYIVTLKTEAGNYSHTFQITDP